MPLCNLPDRLWRPRLPVAVPMRCSSVRVGPVRPSRPTGLARKWKRRDFNVSSSAAEYHNNCYICVTPGQVMYAYEPQKPGGGGRNRTAVGALQFLIRGSQASAGVLFMQVRVHIRPWPFAPIRSVPRYVRGMK
jgi:hypothetical protein